MQPTRELALVTGASNGIGLEMAKILAKNGCDLVLVARDEERLNSLAQEIRTHHPVDVKVMPQDLSLPHAAQALFEQTKLLSTPITILVNNAGYGDFGFFQAADAARIQGMIDVNISSLTLLTRLLLPAMLAQNHGRILNVASTAAFQPGPLMAVYYATKAYVLSFSEAIANELAGSGVSVTVLCPGPTQSGFQANANMQTSKLFNSKAMVLMTSPAVARLGINGMMKGQLVVITGWLNRLLVFSVRFLPRRLLASIVRRIQAQQS